MTDAAIHHLSQALHTSFIDAAHVSEPSLQAGLVANDSTKVLDILRQELELCTEFCASVAFITQGGLTSLLQNLKQLQERGVRARILTTDYLTFTDPVALARLAKLSNVEVRLFRTAGAVSEAGFHTKGYLFRTEHDWRFVIGSSNLTSKALTTSCEWNTRLVVRPQGALAQQVLSQFDLLWSDPRSKPLDEVLDAYGREYAFAKLQRANTVVVLPEAPALEPNSMQRELVANVLELMDTSQENADAPRRALLISATGTGKTYASAFVVQALRPKRALFLVHRELIAQQASESYARVLGARYSYGIFSGHAHEADAGIVFATMQTMVKSLEDFDPDAFDVIQGDRMNPS